MGIPNWALVCGLEWDQKRTNKTLAPMGLRLFYQLLTSPKLPLIIFNTTKHTIIRPYQTHNPKTKNHFEDLRLPKVKVTAELLSYKSILEIQDLGESDSR